jgi:hypothetical protein
MWDVSSSTKRLDGPRLIESDKETLSLEASLLYTLFGPVSRRMVVVGERREGSRREQEPETRGSEEGWGGARKGTSAGSRPFVHAVGLPLCWAGAMGE